MRAGAGGAQEGMVRSVDATFIKMFGYESAEEVVGMPASAIISQSDAADLTRRMALWRETSAGKAQAEPPRTLHCVASNGVTTFQAEVTVLFVPDTTRDLAGRTEDLLDAWAGALLRFSATPSPGSNRSSQAAEDPGAARSGSKGLGAKGLRRGAGLSFSSERAAADEEALLPRQKPSAFSGGGDSDGDHAPEPACGRPVGAGQPANAAAARSGSRATRRVYPAGSQPGAAMAGMTGAPPAGDPPGTSSVHPLGVTQQQLQQGVARPLAETVSWRANAAAEADDRPPGQVDGPPGVRGGAWVGRGAGPVLEAVQEETEEGPWSTRAPAAPLSRRSVQFLEMAEEVALLPSEGEEEEGAFGDGDEGSGEPLHEASTHLERAQGSLMDDFIRDSKARPHSPLSVPSPSLMPRPQRAAANLCGRASRTFRSHLPVAPSGRTFRRSTAIAEQAHSVPRPAASLP